MKFFAVVSTVLTLCGLAAASPVPAPADSVNEHAQVLATLEGRQGACGVWTAATKLDGNGSPRQRYLHKQLSQVLTCDPENGCSVGESQSTSYTIGWSISTGTAVTQWITGGFDVSMSWSTGNQYTCMGGPGDSICINRRYSTRSRRARSTNALASEPAADRRFLPPTRTTPVVAFTVSLEPAAARASSTGRGENRFERDGFFEGVEG